MLLMVSYEHAGCNYVMITVKKTIYSWIFSSHSPVFSGEKKM